MHASSLLLAISSHHCCLLSSPHHCCVLISPPHCCFLKSALLLAHLLTAACSSPHCCLLVSSLPLAHVAQILQEEHQAPPLPQLRDAQLSADFILVVPRECEGDAAVDACTPQRLHALLQARARQFNGKVIDGPLRRVGGGGGAHLVLLFPLLKRRPPPPLLQLFAVYLLALRREEGGVAVGSEGCGASWREEASHVVPLPVPSPPCDGESSEGESDLEGEEGGGDGTFDDQIHGAGHEEGLGDDVDEVG
mmetsp:Transcript_32401/g.66978  ORF Transcript_32401/g.66978 Transcript_32401/m.66978 type:complete len:250 (-) Transcript_32401:945-1694(-)